MTIKGLLRPAKSYAQKLCTYAYRKLLQPMKKLEPDFEIIVSFVHAYEDGVKTEDNRPMPALWRIKNAEDNVYSYPFPRAASDFHNLQIPISGEIPNEDFGPLQKLPRFGLTGLSSAGDYIYAGSWNAVYKINKKTLQLEALISHRLMCDLHGIYCDENYIYTCLTCKDTLVISDYNGKIVDKITIGKDLKVSSDESLEKHDWRFVSKQFRGSVGLYHFNFIQKFENEIYLTSRNLNGFVVIDLEKRECYLQPISFSVPALIHDGVKVGEKYYFTSINGKILVVTNATSNKQGDVIYNRGLKVEEIPLKRSVNWCRGVAVRDDLIIVNVNGRYDTDLPLGVRAISTSGKYIGEVRLDSKKAGFKHKTKYQTGFDILLP